MSAKPNLDLTQIAAGQVYEDIDPRYIPQRGPRLLTVLVGPQGALGMVAVMSNRGRATKIRADRLLSKAYRRREDLENAADGTSSGVQKV